MGCHVCLDSIQRGEGTIASGTLIRLRVCVLVGIQLHRGSEGLRATIAEILTLRTVDAQVMRVHLMRLKAVKRADRDYANELGNLV